MDKSENLAKTVKDLMWAEPFWGLFLIGFRKSWDEKISTACVSKNGINYGLNINPGFWEGLANEDWRKGILQHEAIHIGYHHLERWGDFPDKEVANIAADIVVNQDCRAEWLPCKDMSKEEYEKISTPIMQKIQKDLQENRITGVEAKAAMHQIPPRGVYLEDFKELKLKAREGIQYYYDKLMKDGRGGKDDKGEGKSKFLKSLLDNKMCDGNGPMGHDLWKEFEKLSEAEKKLLNNQLDYQLREVAQQVKKSRGVVPGNIQGYLDGLDNEEPAKFNWRAYLRRFSGGSVKTYTKKLRRKYNKRFEDNPGLRIKQRKHIFLAIDTSGSVSDDELRIFFQEINHITRTGTEITVCQCDSSISNITKYKPGMKINAKDSKIAVYGRGGTDFDPPIDYFNEHSKEFSCMIYFTDGECSPPQNPPKEKLLWVLSGGNDNPDLPGYRIIFEN